MHDPETGKIIIYYEAADTYLAAAYAKVDELVDYIKNNSELVPGDAEDYR